MGRLLPEGLLLLLLLLLIMMIRIMILSMLQQQQQGTVGGWRPLAGVLVSRLSAVQVVP
jgi:hypothetical protein